MRLSILVAVHAILYKIKREIIKKEEIIRLSLILLYIISDNHLISETLYDRDACCEHGVQWEDDIIQQYRINAARMSYAVFVLQAFVEEESTIEHAVQCESNYVQCYEIKV